MDDIDGVTILYYGLVLFKGYKREIVASEFLGSVFQTFNLPVACPFDNSISIN